AGGKVARRRVTAVGDREVGRLELVGAARVAGETAIAAQLHEPVGVAAVARAVEADEAAAASDPRLEGIALVGGVNVAASIGEDDDIESGEVAAVEDGGIFGREAAPSARLHQ